MSRRALAAAAVTVIGSLTIAGCTATESGAPEPGTGAPSHHAVGSVTAPPARPAAGTAQPQARPASEPASPPARQAGHSGPCAHNRAAQTVIVSIAEQHLWMCARHRLVRHTAVTTGALETGTPTGHYRIEGRARNTTLTLLSGATYEVKYWIPFDAPLFGFHDSSWQHFPYGSGRYRTRGSHGCVHMPLRAIAFLYRWAARPTRVRIR